MRRTKYSTNDIERFFRLLKAYKQALETGTKKDIISMSLVIHAAKGNVPPRMRSLVGRTFRETTRKIPLTE